jgi:hypothetical protein
MRTLRVVALVAALVAGAGAAHAQRATERFIPLGRSPGISGSLTAIGRIVAVDAERRRIQLLGPAGIVGITLQDTTSIWIDRHELGLGAATGSFEDCQQGLTAEVKYADPDTRQLAEWIKLLPRAGEP